MMNKLPVSIVIILMLLNLVPPVSADGIPMVEIEVYSTLRENRQLAYIKVFDDSERLELFLNLASLEPDRNITVAIPLRTKPQDVSGQNITSGTFLDSHGFREVERLIELHRTGKKDLFSNMGETTYRIALGEMLGGFGLWVMYMFNTNLASTGEAAESYDLESGVHVDIYAIGSARSLSALYSSLNISTPNAVGDMVDRYSDHYVAVIKARSSPPIPAEEFEALKISEAAAFDRFVEFVKAHSRLTAYADAVVDPEQISPRNLIYENKELFDIYSTIDRDSTRYFEDLVAAVYGLGKPGGFQISFQLPLYKGRAYFPLGTTPAWSGVAKTQVLFDCDDDKEIQFNKDADEVYMNGRHYYYWDFVGSAPDYDLEGNVADASIGTKLEGTSFWINTWIFDNNKPIATGIVFTLFAIIWLVMVILIFNSYKMKLDRKSAPFIIAVSLLGFITSIAITMILSFFIVNRLVRNKKIAMQG